MRPPALAVLLAVAVASPALAGCVGAAQATAMEVRSAADEAALNWQRDAKLAQVVGLEGNLTLVRWGVGLLLGDVPHDGADEDARVGDGRAAAWLYRYVAPGRSDAYVVVVAQDGKVRRADAEPARDDDIALAQWRLDSHEALRIATDANQGIRRGTGAGGEYGVLSVLKQEGARPVWVVLAGGRGGEAGGLGYVKLDAASGDVVESWGRFGER